MAAKRTTEARYVMEVVRIAQMVPTGMEACGSARSPDRLEPAMIPATKLVLEKWRYKEGVLVVLQVFTFILFFKEADTIFYKIKHVSGSYLNVI